MFSFPPKEFPLKVYPINKASRTPVNAYYRRFFNFKPLSCKLVHNSIKRVKSRYMLNFNV